MAIEIRRSDLLGQPAEASTEAPTEGPGDFFARLENILGLVDRLLSRLGALQNNPVLRQMLEQRMGQMTAGEGPAPKGGDVHTPENLYAQAVAGLEQLVPMFGDKTLRELLTYIKANPELAKRALAQWAGGQR